MCNIIHHMERVGMQKPPRIREKNLLFLLTTVFFFQIILTIFLLLYVKDPFIIIYKSEIRFYVT